MSTRRHILALSALLTAFACPCAVSYAQTEQPSSQVAETQTAETPDAATDAVDPRANKAIELYATGDVEGAYNLFKQIHDDDPDSDPPGVLLALLHSHAGKFLDMRRSLEQTAEDYPNDPETFLQLANIDIQENRFLEAQLLVERADKLIAVYKEHCPETTSRLDYLKEEALTARANLAERRGRYDEAKTLVQKIVEQNAENAQAFWDLGYLSMKTNQYDEAESAYDRAAELNPELWPGWLQVCAALDREDLVDEGKARIALKKDAIANAPKDQRAQVARLYLRWHMIDEAMEIVDGFVQDNLEKDLDRWLLTGWIALYASKYAVAESNFRNATLVDPDSFEASNGLALALLDQRNKEKLARAAQIATRNYHMHPDNVDAAVTYAWTLFLTGKQKEANEIFGPMLSSGQMTATVAYYLAEIAFTRGEKEMTRTLLRLALSQKANFPKRMAANELKALVDGEQEEEPSPFDDFDEEAFPDDEEAEEDAAEKESTK